jgi:hypothetical protein
MMQRDTSANVPYIWKADPGDIVQFASKDGSVIEVFAHNLQPGIVLQKWSPDNERVSQAYCDVRQPEAGDEN